ncbi:hypothetical protein KI387_037830, partial [Taxus chinensis]
MLLSNCTPQYLPTNSMHKHHSLHIPGYPLNHAEMSENQEEDISGCAPCIKHRHNAAIASLCMLFIITVVGYYFYFRRYSIIYHSQNSEDGHKHYDWSGIMLMAAVTSLCMVFIVSITVYCVYFRPYANTTTHGRLRIPSRGQGLRRAMVDALPVFVYKPECFKDGLHCAVCLCDFQENENGRMLPSCNHSFHVERSLDDVVPTVSVEDRDHVQATERHAAWLKMIFSQFFFTVYVSTKL